MVVVGQVVHLQNRVNVYTGRVMQRYGGDGFVGSSGGVNIPDYLMNTVDASGGSAADYSQVGLLDRVHWRLDRKILAIWLW